MSLDLDAFAQQTKQNSMRQSSLLLWLIVLLLLIFVIWAALTELDRVTRADGRITSSQNNQVMQAVDPGVLLSVHVAEGDLVEKGQLILELDRVYASSQLDQEEQKYFSLLAKIARLNAEIEGKDPEFTVTLQEQAPESVRNERDLFSARRDELANERDVLGKQIQQLQQDLRRIKEEKLSAERTLELVRAEMKMVAPLVKKKIEPETSLLALKRSLEEWSNKLSSARSDAIRIEASIAETRQKVVALDKRFRSEALESLADSNAALAELEKRLPALRERVSRSEVRAPVRGVVNRLFLQTLGGFAQAGQELVEIVPIEETVMVEAYIKPTDMAFLYPGQPVKVAVTAYDYARYGSMDGELVRIGADAVKHPSSEENIFISEIKTTSSIKDLDGEPVELVPGMTVSVDILAGKKTVLDYLTEPVVKIKSRALRE